MRSDLLDLPLSVLPIVFDASQNLHKQSPKLHGSTISTANGSFIVSPHVTQRTQKEPQNERPTQRPRRTTDRAA